MLSRMFWRSTVAIRTLAWISPLILAKFILYHYGLEFLSPDLLVGSVVTGALFTVGFIMAGLVADYKEAEKMTVEMRVMLEKFWGEAKKLSQVNPKFELKMLRQQLELIIESFIKGVNSQRGFPNLKPCIQAIKELERYIDGIERLGAMPSSISRMKDTIENLLKIVFRIYYMQRIAYLPSARLLADILAFGTIIVVYFTQSGSFASVIVSIIISYFMLYLRNLIHVLDTPFRQGEKTQDDISLFLLKEFYQEISTKLIEV